MTHASTSIVDGESTPSKLRALQMQRDAKVAEMLRLDKEARFDEFSSHQLRTEIAFLDQRIADLARQSSCAPVTAAVGGNEDEVGIGTRVVVQWEDGGEAEYTIVAPAEAAPSAARISCASPVGLALLGRRVGEQVQVATPGGPRVLNVVHLEHKPRVNEPASATPLTESVEDGNSAARKPAVCCATCGLEIEWEPLMVAAKPYCCTGCAQGGPCCCSYDRPDGDGRA